MDYKETLNLPRTDFSMKADLAIREPERLAVWESSSLYREIQEARAGEALFVLHDGPPFANGDVHIGTALNKILKDIIIKYKGLRGFRAPYVPGWDCHGLPIEFKVSQEMRKQGDTSVEPNRIRSACEAYARKYIDIQRRQFRRLGILGDWDRPYLTLDRNYEAEELRLFANLVDAGFVYRGKKPIYWSIPCRTALAEAEVEYRDHVSQSLYVKFPVLDQPNMFVLIWTTTPWTLPANLAIAYSSTLSYSLVRVGQETYLLSTFLISELSKKAGWESYEIMRSLTADHLRQIQYRHPFCDRTGQLLAGDHFVEATTGTGFVHIAPGHGLEDYGLGLQNGLPIYSPVDDDGRFVHTQDLPAAQQMPAALLGKSTLEKSGRSEANEAVLDLLRAGGFLLHQEDYPHSYPHCWRSKTPIIFRAMDQWFIRIDHEVRGKTFRNTALEAVAQVRWIPDWGRSRMEAAIQARPDWCISRQRTWGVPIPAFYDSQGEPILHGAVVRRTADLFEQKGSNVWFELPCAELWAAVRPEGWPGPDPASKSTDTLDVWIDSGSSSRAVVAQHPEYHRSASEPPRWQADLYLEGSDQHRGWFQSSLLLSLAGNGSAPFRTVLTHGFMVDADREKISKSKQGQGSYEKPQTAEAYIKKWGADIVRLWVSSQDFRSDIVVSEERISKVAETYRVIRNALRYQLSNLYDFDPETHAVAGEQLTGLDRWLLHEFTRLEETVAAAYDACEYHVVYQQVSQFAAVQLSATYHDIVKDRLYTDPADSHRRRSTQTALHQVLTGLCRILSPILAFTADEAASYIPGRKTRSIHLDRWDPSPAPPAATEPWDLLFQIRERVFPELERARQSKQIGKALEAAVIVSGAEAGRLDACRESLREILNVSQLQTRPAEGDWTVNVEKASGSKCDRCWHYELDVGQNARHPALCGRCVSAVEA